MRLTSINQSVSNYLFFCSYFILYKFKIIIRRVFPICILIGKAIVKQLLHLELWKYLNITCQILYLRITSFFSYLSQLPGEKYHYSQKMATPKPMAID